jgi:hypothetical protein
MPARQRVIFKSPATASDSTKLSALPNSERGLYEKSLPPTLRITSRCSKIPAAGEALAPSVIAICRASVVVSLSLKIHPRAPVAPSVHVFFPCYGIGSPLVRSGFWIVTFGPPASAETVKSTVLSNKERLVFNIDLGFTSEVAGICQTYGGLGPRRWSWDREFGNTRSRGILVGSAFHQGFPHGILDEEE